MLEKLRTANTYSQGLVIALAYDGCDIVLCPRTDKGKLIGQNQVDKVATAQFAVQGKIEDRQFTNVHCEL